MTNYINRQRKCAEKVRFTELKRRQHMSVILETRQLCKFYGAGENQVKAVNQIFFMLKMEPLFSDENSRAMMALSSDLG